MLFKRLLWWSIVVCCWPSANNHIYVIAYAIVDVENKDNWKWFLSLLQNDLGQHTQHGWNFISDMQKVLLLVQYMLILLVLITTYETYISVYSSFEQLLNYD